MSARTFSPEEITTILAESFGAPLIISTIGLIIYGVNVCQLVEYASSSAKRDHHLTKIWVCLVMIFNTASMIYQVYFNWRYCITSFLIPDLNLLDAINGIIVVFYSVVITLVQFFWLSCIKKSMASKPKLSWIIITPLALLSFSSFIIAIAVGVLARTRPGAYGTWPTPLISKLLRSVLALYLAVDLAILIVLVTQLTLMKRNTIHHKTTISKLSWILIGTTLTTTVLMIAELIIELPEPVYGKPPIDIVITFAPLFPPIYSFGILAVLNARSNLWPLKSKAFSQPSEGGSRLIPGLNFTVDLPDPIKDSASRAASVESPTMA